jgi:hypothetical protein
VVQRSYPCREGARVRGRRLQRSRERSTRNTRTTHTCSTSMCVRERDEENGMSEWGM